MPGPKKKPTHLKVLEGTLRPYRTNENEPDPSTESPEPPEWLSEMARRYFLTVRGRLEDIGLSSASYTEMLAELALRLEDIERLTGEIQSRGWTFEQETREGSIAIRANPAVSQRSDALRHAQSLLAEFGLSPASMSKVSVKGQKKSENPFAQLKDMKR